MKYHLSTILIAIFLMWWVFDEYTEEQSDKVERAQIKDMVETMNEHFEEQNRFVQDYNKHHRHTRGNNEH